MRVVRAGDEPLRILLEQNVVHHQRQWPLGIILRRLGRDIAHRDHDLPAIGRPCERRDIAFDIGQFLGLAALSIEQVDLVVIVLVAGRGKRDGAPIGAECG